MQIAPVVPGSISGVFRDLPDAVVAIELTTKSIVYENLAAQQFFQISHLIGRTAEALTQHLDHLDLIEDALGRLALSRDDSESQSVSFLANRQGLDEQMVDATISTYPGTSPDHPLAICRIKTSRLEPISRQDALLLPEVARVLLNATDDDAALADVARLAIPGLADLCSIFILEEDLTVRQVAVAHRDPTMEQLSRLIHSRFPPKVSGARGTIRTLLDGKPSIVNRIDEEFFAMAAPDERQRALLRRLKIKSYMAVPFLARGHVVGAMTLSSSRPNRYQPGDLALAEGLATITALAVDGYRQRRAAQHASSQLSRAQHELGQNEKLRAMGQMTSGISHDVNNSLSMILGLTEILMNRDADLNDVDGPRGAMQMIQKTAEDAVQTVRGLRQFYLPVEMDVSKRPVDLSEVVEQVARLTRPRWRDQALAKGITIRVESHLADVPLLLGQDSDLRQALTNLIFNSVDALPRGGVIAMHTRVLRESIVVEVADTGEGMTDEILRQCLDPYFTTKGNNGSGLGLPMVLTIVQRHGGTLAIESAVGQGTSVTLNLPIQQRATRSASASRGTTPEHQLKLLLIGFSSLESNQIGPALVGDGHAIVSAATGDEGARAFAENAFDAVLLDAEVRATDANSVGASIRRINPLAPIILVDNLQGEARSSISISPPIDAVVARPLTLRAVRRAINQVGLS
uniref:histidine kinase n=1 Tax=uncultured bacterium F25-01 TaxID=1191433 RepID=I3VIF1_9BACT|nr:two-component hybrid sensor/regulator [uncultured bacterium F25-01]